MRKLTPLEYEILRRIADAGGSFCPDDATTMEAHRALNDLVKAKRLRVETVDTGARYHLTVQGVADAAA